MCSYFLHSKTILSEIVCLTMQPTNLHAQHLQLTFLNREIMLFNFCICLDVFVFLFKTWFDWLGFFILFFGLFDFIRTGFVLQQVRWFLGTRAKSWTTMRLKLRWGTVRRGAASLKNAPLWTSLFKQKQKPSPPHRTQPHQPWPLPQAQHSPQPRFLIQRTAIAPSKADSLSLPPSDEANPKESLHQSSTAFINPGAREEAYCKWFAGGKAKRPF